MTRHRILAILSSLILVYFAITQGFVSFIFASSGATSSLGGKVLTIIYVISFACFFVASYRQLNTQRPKLITMCLFFLIISNVGSMFLNHLISNDPVAQSFQKQMNEAIITSAETIENPDHKALMLEYANQKAPTLFELLKDLAFSLLLMTIPMYTNFRKLPNDP